MKKGTVLVVHDDDATHSVVAGILADAGYGVVRVYDAVSALCVQAAVMLEAVVTDGGVHGTDGTTLLCKLNDLDPGLPLVVRPARKGVS